jgi:hypothetical protein
LFRCKTTCRRFKESLDAGKAQAVPFEPVETPSGGGASPPPGIESGSRRLLLSLRPNLAWQEKKSSQARLDGFPLLGWAASDIVPSGNSQAEDSIDELNRC